MPAAQDEEGDGRAGDMARRWQSDQQLAIPSASLPEDEVGGAGRATVQETMERETTAKSKTLVTMKYVVTGINRLTGEREPVTKPHRLWKTREMRDKLAAKQHSRSAYKWLKVEPAIREGDIW